MASYLLGTDNGCTMAKAALFTLDGRELAVASRKVDLISPRPGFNEMDMRVTWSATAQSIREVLSKSGIDPRDIVAIASAGHGNGLYLVDKRGEPVRNAISSMDSRARACVDRWRAAGIDRRIRPATMQSVWPAQPNALLNWLRDNEPDALRRAGWVLMCKDYVRFCLTGRIAAELTDMSGTSLLNVGRREYDDEVLEAFGIGAMRGLMPPLVKSAELCGKVTASAAAETGLAEGTPVAGGMFDIDACGLASGMVDESALCMVAGTWGNNQYISRTPVVSEDVFMTSCYAMDGWYLMLEGSATSASNLEWFVGQFMPRGEEGGSVFEQCNREVERIGPGDASIVFLPYVFGSNVNSDARGTLLGLSNWHTRGHVLRAVYEGVVFAHRQHVERLMRFRPPAKEIRLTGGASRSQVWVQIYADCFGLPVRIPEGAELGALGAAICAAVAAGCYPTWKDAVAAMVRFARTQEPNPANNAAYDAKYEKYLRVISALDPVWEMLAGPA